MTTTRSLYAPETFLAAYKGIAAYTYDASDRSFMEAAVTPSEAALQLYEVAIIDGQGSWWAPTAPLTTRPQSWPAPVLPLEASGSGIWTTVFGDTVYRPQTFFWWIPGKVLSQIPIQPTINQGTVSGDFPLTEPIVSA